MNWRISLVIGLMATAVAAQDSLPVADPNAPHNDGEQAKTARRLEVMTQAAGRYEIHIGQNQTKSELLLPPLLRWTNPQSTARDGVLVAWSRGGRPDVIAQYAFYPPGTLIHEFSSTCTDSLIMRRGSEPLWIPSGGGVEFRDFPEAPVPGKTALQRGVQMRSLAERFTVMDDHGWEVTVKQQLRLMSKPLLRYVDPEVKVVDGAVFAFVLTTDPEAALFVEAYEATDGLKWRFGFSPVTVYALQASLDGQLVWDRKERRGPHSPDEIHISTRYQPEPDEPNYAELLPVPQTKAEGN